MPNTVNLTNVDQVASLLKNATAAMLSNQFRRGSSVRLPARGRLLVTGDLHDNPEHLRKIIFLAKLDASPDHHVVLHELIHSERLVNGVDLSHRVLLRVASLVVDFPQQVHVVLANHELAQMTGQGISKGAGNSVELFNHGLEFVFGGDWERIGEAVNAFIAAMPLAIVSDSGVLCAHSLPAPRAMERFDIGILDRAMTDDDYEPRTGSAYLMTWGRGYQSEQLEKLASAWDVKLFCLGHQHVETGIELTQPGVLVLNSDHESAAVLPVDLAEPPEPEMAVMSAIKLGAIPAPQ